MISATSRLCAVIGDPVEHSMSPQIHNSAFQACGIDMAYVAFHVKQGDLRRALEGVRSLGIRGLSVTIPHKVDIIAYLDKMDDVSRHVGSINTVVNEDGCLVGYSTDGPGAVRALAAEGAKIGGRTVLLLGSGGAARAVAFSLADLKTPPILSILGIEEDELERLGTDLEERTVTHLSCQPLNPETLANAMAEADVVIHATPVGMTPQVEKTLIPAELIKQDQVIFDIVYTPLETRLIREAKAAGALTVVGLGMFVHQAAIQFELWTGQRAPLELMTDTVRAALGEMG
jgi:shikimate dehydrogenase